MSDIPRFKSFKCSLWQTDKSASNAAVVCSIHYSCLLHTQGRLQPFQIWSNIYIFSKTTVSWNNKSPHTGESETLTGLNEHCQRHFFGCATLAKGVLLPLLLPLPLLPLVLLLTKMKAVLGLVITVVMWSVSCYQLEWVHLPSP